MNLRRHAPLTLACLLCVAAWAQEFKPFAVSSDATADKPQSKCWFHDGSWWAILSDGVDGARFYRLGDDGDGLAWSAPVFADALVASGARVRVDVVADGDLLTVLAWEGEKLTLHKYTYEASSGFYRRALADAPVALPPPPPPVPSVSLGVLPTPPGLPGLPGIPSSSVPAVGFLPPAPGSLPPPVTPAAPRFAAAPLRIDLPAGHETATVAVDTRGRAWVTAVVAGDVLVTAPGVSRVPTVLASGLNDDDISAVVAFGGRVGVFWSNQNAQSLGFRYRDATDPLGDWRPAEVVARGGHVADDHINIAVASDGTLYVVTKTSVDDVPRPVDGPTQAQIILNVRTPAGVWSMADVAPVSEVFTSRPIVVLDEDHARLYVVYRHGDEIVYRSSARASIDFSAPARVALSAAGVTLRNVTSAKSGVHASTGLLIVATGSDGRAYSAVLPLSPNGS